MHRAPTHTHIAHSWTRTIAAVLIASITLMPIQAAAVYPVYDAVNARLTVQQTIQDKVNLGYNAITASVQNLFANKELVLDGIAWALAKAVVDSIVRSTIQWAQSGFEGSPAFVQNLSRHLARVGDKTVQGVLGTFKLNYAKGLQNSLKQNALGAYSNTRSNASGRVNQSVIAQTSNFKDLSTIGSGKPNSASVYNMLRQINHPYGTPIQAQQSLDTAVLAAQTAAENNSRQEIAQAGGYQSAQKCISIDGGLESCTITTPGKNIADSVNKSIGTGLDTLISADEINELVSALVGGLMQKLFAGSGISHGGSGSRAGGGSAGLAGLNLSANNGNSFIGYSNANEQSSLTVDTSQIVQLFKQLLSTQKEARSIHQKIVDDIITFCGIHKLTDERTASEQAIKTLDAYIPRITADAAAVNATTTLANASFYQSRYSEYVSNPALYTLTDTLQQHSQEIQDRIDNNCQ